MYIPEANMCRTKEKKNISECFFVDLVMHSLKVLIQNHV